MVACAARILPRVLNQKVVQFFQTSYAPSMSVCRLIPNPLLSAMMLVYAVSASHIIGRMSMSRPREGKQMRFVQ